MTPEQFPLACEAKCDRCGHIWLFERGEAFHCPFCNLRFNTVEFGYNKDIAFFYGETWKEYNRKRDRALAKTAPEYLTKPHSMD